MRIRGEQVLVMTEWRGGDARRRASSREMPSLLFLSEYPASTHLISSDLGGAEGDLGGLCFIPEARASFRRRAPHFIVPGWSRFTSLPRHRCSGESDPLHFRLEEGKSALT